MTGSPDDTHPSPATAACMASCAAPERYIQQLASHWSHKFDAAYDKASATGTFAFSGQTYCTMAAREGGIAISLRTADAADNLRMRGVIEKHLDRFAFREAPLSYAWTDQ